MNNSGKWYDLFEMSANGNYTLNVTLGASINDEQLCVWIDYDNNGSFNNGNEQIYLNNDIPFVTGLNGISINFTVPAASFISTGQIVRMRMMDDRSTALGVAAMNSSSATLSYGQAEDYPVYLQSGPLPLTLLSFTGSKRNDVIRLLWKTEQEQDTKEFQVERSMNSFEFASIGIIPAAGLSTGSNYNFSDPAITPGAYFYRLKMLDRDGAYTYSRTLDFTVKGNRMLVKGNPFHQDIEVILPANSGEVVFRLLDSKGSVVLVEKQGISSNSIVIKLKKPLSNGIYVLEATVNGEYFSEKVIRQ
ncbi:MAG: GEVED domain-containing protein [Ferruginibacter sp.]